jgi:hypothetical protein
MIKTGFLFVLLCISMKAAISAPLFVVEKATDGQRLTMTVTCSQIPELKSITFTCSYTVPKAMLMEAIVSSPQPGTALTVRVDSATATLSITIRATTTITPAENARILVLKIPGAATIITDGLTVTKATFSDKNGAPTPATIITKTTSIDKPFAIAAPSCRKHAAGDITMYRIDGKKVSVLLLKPVCGMSIMQRNGSGAAPFISVR